MKNGYGSYLASGVGLGALSFTTQCLPFPENAGAEIIVTKSRSARNVTGGAMAFMELAAKPSGHPKSESTRQGLLRAYGGRV